MNEQKAIIAALSLLVIALVGIVVVGALMTTIQGVKGDDGKQGPRGTTGLPPSPVSGFLSQVQTQFTIDDVNLTQSSAVVTLRVNATLASNLDASTTYIIGSITDIDLPSVTTTGTAYLIGSSSQAPVILNAVDGSVVIGPMPITWNSGENVSLSATYMVV